MTLPRFNGQAKVVKFDSYSKGTPNPWSDIDVAIIVPALKDEKKFETSVALGKDRDKVSMLTEPVLMAENHWSPLYDGVMRTGIIVRVRLFPKVPKLFSETLGELENNFYLCGIAC